jgi:DNA modification methylase
MLSASSSQLMLWRETEPAGEFRLHLKEFLQPFERALALRELAALGFEIVSANDRAHIFHVKAGSSDQAVRNLRRLTYFDSYVGTEGAQLTGQAIRESQPRTGDTEIRVVRRRVLRFAPHDFHEYRGKFFPQLARSLCNIAGIEPGSVVADPMCGSGTTLVEARVLGMRVLGIDTNHLSVLVSRVKTAAAGWSEQRIGDLRDLLQPTLQFEFDSDWPWSEADTAYLHRWFTDAALGEIAALLRRIRAVPDAEAQAFASVCLSDVLRGVSHQKEDDLRVRKEIKPYSAGTATERYTSSLLQHIQNLAGLASRHEKVPAEPFAVEQGDARQFSKFARQFNESVSAVITSPPYATALPYLDTDRLSLVVLGLLSRDQHPTAERDMIGTREIGQREKSHYWKRYLTERHRLPDTITKQIDVLAKAYHSDSVGFRRQNLPTLLARYFLDMLDVLREVNAVLSNGGTAFFVVGNNSTVVESERIEIHTDTHITALAESLGFAVRDPVNMELLGSRDIFSKNRGSREQVLEFRKEQKRVRNSVELSSRRDLHVADLSVVDDEDWNFVGADTQYALHNLHPYPAKFIPQIPRRAIERWTREDDTILDPFCGSGTTLLECALTGRNSIGVDNNGVATLVCQAKTAKYSNRSLMPLAQLLKDTQSRLRSGRFRTRLLSSAASNIPDYPSIRKWFAEPVLAELAWLRGQIEGLPLQSRLLATATFSALLVQASRQDSDTRYAAVEREWEPGWVVKTWIRKTIDAVERALETTSLHRKARHAVHTRDSRDLGFIESGSVHCIITSPPYLNAYDYHKYHRHRLWWTGSDVALARDKEIGKHDVYTRPGATPDSFFEDLAACLREWKRVLVTRGRALVLVGDAIVSGEFVPVGDRLIELADAVGMSMERRWVRQIDSNSKSFNHRARMKREHVLLLRNS